MPTLSAAPPTFGTTSGRPAGGPAHHRRLGLVLAAQGRDVEAADALRRALDLDPGDDPARDALGRLEAQS